MLNPHFLNKKTNYENPFETIWTVIDGHWLCVTDDKIDECLADYLYHYGFDIPETISYCIAQNQTYSLKYRQYGGTIHLYIH